MGFFDNFPRRRVAAILRFIIFPFGRRYHPPADELTRQLADNMMQLSTFRDRITQYCYIGDSMDDPTGCVELAFAKMVEVAPLLKILQQANKAGKFPASCNDEEKLSIAEQLNLLDGAQCRQLREFFVMQKEALEVDVFAASYFDARRADNREQENN